MRIVPALLASVLLSGCSSSSRQVDLAADERAIRELAVRWQQALLDRDAATHVHLRRLSVITEPNDVASFVLLERVPSPAP